MSFRSVSSRFSLRPSCLGSAPVARGWALGALGLGLLSACAGEPPRGAAGPPEPLMTRAATVVDTTAEYPRLRYEDGMVSLNDRCPVRRVRLNPKMPPVRVNGHPVGFC